MVRKIKVDQTQEYQDSWLQKHDGLWYRKRLKDKLVLCDQEKPSIWE